MSHGEGGPPAREAPPAAARALRLWVVTFAGLTATLVLLSAAHRFNPLAGGLRGDYYEGTTLAARPVHSLMGRVPSRSDLVRAWDGSLPRTFTATWGGWTVLDDPGNYRFAIDSPQQASLWLDGRQVATAAVDAAQGPSIAIGTGVHALFVQYTHRDGPVRIEVRSCREGRPCTPLDASQLYAQKPRGATVVALQALRSALVAVGWAWAALLPMLMVGIVWGVSRSVKRSLQEEGLWQRCRWVLLGSLALNLAGIWWGLPAIWVPDELTPGTVMGALSQHFSHGWYDRWPPFHYYTLTVATSPVLLLHALGRIEMFGAPWPTVMLVVSRLVSIVFAAGIVTAVSLVGSRVFNRRVGVFAAAIFALATPFLYYAKTANLDVPYVFWFAVSLVYYQRILGPGAVRDFALFGLFSTLAICTKDQAYALYLLMPVAVLVKLGREYASRGRPWWQLATDRGLIAAVGTAVVVFALCHNLLFNLGGFIDHVKYIAGPGNENYRAFPPTLAGRAALLVLTGHLIKISWGWPLTVAAIAGLALAFSRPEQRWKALVLLAPVVSYYLAFVNVILYNYDRFVLPICIVLSMFAGLFFDWLLSSARPVLTDREDARPVTSRPVWQIAGVTAVFIYTLLYSATVDVLMIRDSRYEVEGWIREQVRASDLVGVSGPPELLPRLEVAHADVSTLSALADTRPAFYVLSADYAHAVPLTTEWGQLIAALEGNQTPYRLVGTFRRRSPWPWLPDGHPDLIGSRAVPPAHGGPIDPFVIARIGVFSILRSVDPTIKVFRLDPSVPR